MKFVVSLFFTISAFLALAQSQKSIQVFINPFIQKYGNLNNQYVEGSNDHIEVNYFKKACQEAGINYQQNYANNWGWSAGLSWKNEHHQFSYRTARFFPGGNFENGNYYVLSAFFQEISVQALGLNLSIYRSLNDRIRLGFMVHQYFRGNILSNRPLPYIQHISEAGVQSPYSITHKINLGEWQHAATVPEVNVSVQLYKNFSIIVGSRFKFWSFENYLDMNVYGSFESSDYGDDPTKILHKSAINSKDISYYFGFTYDIPVIRDIKK